MDRKELLVTIFENYSRLPDEDCAFVLQNFLSEALESDTIFEWELAGKLMTLSDTARETFTKSLNKAIKGNLQPIGGKSVAAWILEYLKKYDGVARNPNTFFEFCSRAPEIKKLARRDQIKLMRILRMYDYFMVEPIMDLESPIDQIFRFPMRLDSSPAEISQQMRSAGTIQPEAAPVARTIVENLPLRDILKKYPAVGEQNITAGQLKLTHFDRPVRPSIRNWIYDYTAQLGQDRHDAMVRMKYLFGSANGKNLSSPDREKLGIILKSFDENIPLPIDAGRSEVVLDLPATQGSTLRNSPDLIGRRERSNLRGANENREAGNQSPTFPSLAVARDSSKSDLSPKPPSFTKPYTPIRETIVPKRETKPPIPQPKGKIEPPDQGSTFPLADESANSSRSNLSDEMRFVNPYPTPGTHEAHFTAPAENIANVRFDEGLPPPVPRPKVAPSPKPTFVHPRNIIEPMSKPRPEPRIEGNIVDLKGDK